MALDMNALLQRCFSIPPGGFILSDILAQLFEPVNGHNHDGVNSAPVAGIPVVDGVTLDANGAAGAVEVAAGGIGTTQLKANAVTSAKIAANAVGANQLATAITGALVTTVSSAPTTDSAVGLYFCTADNKLYYNSGTAVLASAAFS